MIAIRGVNSKEKELINDIVDIHIRTFKHFFLTFMNKGFLRQMYRSYCEYQNAELLVALDHDKAVGFIAYSTDMSGLYKFMLKRHLISFGWYAFLAFLRKPSIFAKLFGAFTKPKQAEREDSYVRLSSIGVDPDCKSEGIGSKLIDEMKSRVDFSRYHYISLETDANDNDAVNSFYQKNDFALAYAFVTSEGREMNEYRYCR